MGGIREQKGGAQTRSSPAKPAGEGGTRDDASSVSQLLHALHWGKGREEDHRKSMEEERQVPEVHLDYMFR